MLFKLIPLVALLGATAAGAVTYTAVNGAPDPGPIGGDTVLVNFDTPVAATGFSLTGSYSLKTSTTQGVAAAPAGDTTQFLYVSPALATNNATLTSPFDLQSIGFYWGSIDAYNSVDVLGTLNGKMQTLYTLGGSAMPPSNGDQFAASTNRRVTFTAGAGEAITGLRFVSTGVAFELDDVAGSPLGSGTESTVPEPASWAMLVAGFGVVGALSRRRRRAALSVAG